MNRLEFLTRMRRRLEQGGLSADDINDALNYYEEIFLDAGPAKEYETADSLGSPENIADDILRDNGLIGDSRNGSSNAQSQNYQQYNNPKKNSAENIILKIIIAALTFPIWLPVLIVIVVMLFTVIVVAASLVFAAIVTGFALIVGGIAAIIDVPAVGIFFIGAGMLLVGLFLLIGRPVFNKVIPAFINLIKDLFSRIRAKFAKGGQNNA